MRAFLAAEIPYELVNKVIKVQKELGLIDAPVKYVEPENLHFTMKFFGEINPEQIKLISNTIKERLVNQYPFEINIRGTGVFPKMEYPRVIWLGVDEPQPFSELQELLDDDWVKMGFKRERSYIPHLTIGRVKGGHNKDVLINKIKELEHVEIGPTVINSLFLKKSELTPAGPIYSNIEQFFLE